MKTSSSLAIWTRGVGGRACEGPAEKETKGRAGLQQFQAPSWIRKIAVPVSNCKGKREGRCLQVADTAGFNRL